MKNKLLKNPLVFGLLGFLLGLFIGLVVLGWWLWPVEWKDASPAYLNADYAADYLRMAIDSYSVNHDKSLAVYRYEALGPLGPAAMDSILNNPGSSDVRAILAFREVVQPGGAVIVVPLPTEDKSANGMMIVIILGAVAALGLIGFLLFKYVFPLFRGFSIGEGSAARRAQQLSNETPMTDYEAMGEEPPISQFITTYVLGDDLFDDSFSIETQAGEFLGECGIGISDSIGVGEPKRVTAFELWLFDKSDIQTVTKVLMSAHAYNDPAIRQRLAAKGEPVLVEPGKQIVLETKALQLVAVVTDMEYGSSSLPDKSHFERITVELAIWPKVVEPS